MIRFREVLFLVIVSCECLWISRLCLFAVSLNIDRGLPGIRGC